MGQSSWAAGSFADVSPRTAVGKSKALLPNDSAMMRGRHRDAVSFVRADSCEDCFSNTAEIITTGAAAG